MGWRSIIILFLILGIVFLIIAGISGFDNPELTIVLSGAGFVLIILAIVVYLFRH